MGKKLTQTEIDFIVSAKAAGVPTSSICQMMGRAKSTVNYAYAKHREDRPESGEARTHIGWTSEEDDIILGHPEMTATELADLLPLRSANACRNRRRRLRVREEQQHAEQVIDPTTAIEPTPARGRVKKILLWLLGSAEER